MNAAAGTPPNVIPNTTPLIHLVDDDEAVRDSLALLIETLQQAVRAHVQARQRHQADRQARERYAQLSTREREVLGLIVATLIRQYAALVDEQG